MNRAVFAPSCDNVVTISVPESESPWRAGAQATALGIPATTLMRHWVIEKMTTLPTIAVVSVADPERLIADT